MPGRSTGSSILERIGRTPLVRLGGMEEAGGARIWGKLEGLNPGGSAKDRICLAMIEAAEAEGRLKRGDTVIEPTSGNTGIGLSMVCAVKGYRLILTMPDSMTLERRRLLAACGAELFLTPGQAGMRGAVLKAEELAAAHGYLLLQQFRNPANPEAHRRTTGPEIIADMGNETIDGFVAGVGTGGTITGTGHALRSHNPAIRIAAIEPDESPVLSGGSPGHHIIQGIGAGFIPEVLDTSVYDEVIRITGPEACDVTRQLARKSGIFAGISSGAAVAGARILARKLGKGKNVVALLPDTGERYLSAGVFD